MRGARSADPGAARSRVARRRGGPGGPRTSAAERARITGRLRRLRERGDLEIGHLRDAAATVGVSVRTVRRWLATTDSSADSSTDSTAGTEPPRSGVRPYVLCEADRLAFQDFHGNVCAVHRARSAVIAGSATAAGAPIAAHLRTGWAGAAPVSRSALYAAFARELDPAERAYWRAGDRARRAHRVVLARVIEHRNQVWQADHTNLDIVVVPQRGRPLRPWLTTFLDLYSRVIMGWAISERPDSGVICCALRAALLPDREFGFGGVPVIIECDQGRDFLSAAVTRPAATLGVHVRPAPPYQGEAKGRIERFHGTISAILLTQLPGYTGGPRDRRGHLYGPVADHAAGRDQVPEDGPDRQDGGLGIAEFAHVFADWARWYHTEHQHSGLGGNTPLQVWRADPTDYDVVDEAELRDLLLVVKDARITKKGVRHNNLHYTHNKIQGRVGQSVEFRYAPHDDRFINVHTLDGEFLCTATPTDAMSPEQSREYRKDWAENSRELARQRRRATARARHRLDPTSSDHPALRPAPHPTQHPTAVPPHGAGSDNSGAAEADGAPHTSEDDRHSLHALDTRLVSVHAPAPPSGPRPRLSSGSEGDLLELTSPTDVPPPVATTAAAGQTRAPHPVPVGDDLLGLISPTDVPFPTAAAEPTGERTADIDGSR